MRRASALKFLVSGLAGALLFHVAFSVAVALWAGDLLQHRMVNIRHVDARPDLKPELVAGFLQVAAKDPRPRIIIAGSSFSWGYSWPEPNVYTAKLAERHPAYKVVNASVIGGDINTMRMITCLLDDHSISAEILVIEYSMPNNIGGQRNPLSCPRGNSVWTSTLPHAWALLRAPFGLGSFRIFWDEYNYPQRERDFAFAPLQDNYFPSKATFDAEIGQFLVALKEVAAIGRRIAPRVVILLSPILREGVAMSQFDPDEIEVMQARLIETCKSIEGVTCLSPPQLEKASYANLTHLNIEGHAAFADWLAGELGLSTVAAAP